MFRILTKVLGCDIKNKDTFLNKKLSYVAYYQATLNEMAMDKYWVQKFYKGRESEILFPRPMKLKIYSTKIPSIMRWVGKILIQIWWIIFPLLLIYQLSKFLLGKFLHLWSRDTKLGGSLLLDISGKTIILGLTSRISDLVPRLQKEERPHVWLTFPWCKLANLPEGDATFSALSVLTYTDILHCLVSAWRGAIISSFLHSQAEARMQTYTAFPWFLTWRVLDKLEKLNVTSVWFANHMDRWAVLIDKHPIIAQRVLMQHGLLFSDEKYPIKIGKIGEIMVMPSKVENVSDLYQLPGSSLDSLTNSFLQLTDEVKVRYLPSSLQLRETGTDNYPSILIIGQPENTEKECLYIQAIATLYPKGIIYIKPHPLHSSKPYSKVIKENVSLIRDKKYFPKVVVAVTEYSTLGLEYEQSGIPVIWTAGISIDEIVEKVKSTISRMS